MSIRNIDETDSHSAEDTLNIEELKKRNIIVLAYYDIMENSDGEILFTITNKSQRTDTHNPRFYYDGNEHAIFLKDERDVTICDQLHPGVRSAVSKVVRGGGEILFVELLDGKIVDEYNVATVWCEGIAEIANDLIEFKDAGILPPLTPR